MCRDCHSEEELEQVLDEDEFPGIDIDKAAERDLDEWLGGEEEHNVLEQLKHEDDHSTQYDAEEAFGFPQDQSLERRDVMGVSHFPYYVEEDELEDARDAF